MFEYTNLDYSCFSQVYDKEITFFPFRLWMNVMRPSVNWICED